MEAQNMRLNIDTEIRFRSGNRAGFLRDLLLDANQEVNEIIMGTDELVPRELVVPVTALSEGPGGVLYIDLDPDQVDTLSTNRMEQIPITEGWDFTPTTASAMGEVFPITTYDQIVPVMEVASVDEDAIILNQGTEVRCLDGRWGIVDEAVLGDDGRITAFVGRADNANQHDRLIPIELVQESTQEAVILNCSIADLPTYTQE